MYKWVQDPGVVAKFNKRGRGNLISAQTVSDRQNVSVLCNRA